MTTRTLEEIEVISCGVTYASGHETYVCDPGEPCRKCLKKRIRAAAAIAQEQSGAIDADEARTRAAAMRVWGEHVRGCDTADAMADLIVSQRAEVERLKAEIARRIDEKKGVCEALGVDWQTVVNLGLKVQQAIGTKR